MEENGRRLDRGREKENGREQRQGGGGGGGGRVVEREGGWKNIDGVIAESPLTRQQYVSTHFVIDSRINSLRMF